MRVLIVEDEERVAADIADALAVAGFLPEIATKGEQAWFQGSTEPYSAIVLDIGLPELDGITILKRWREEGLTTPVIMLTARGSWHERVEGIDSGADDYLPKPFRMEELVARVRSLIRRASGTAQPEISVGPVVLDPRTRHVAVNGIPVNLTPLEFRLLNYLFHNRGRAVSQSELSDNLYSLNSERDSNAIEALIGRLRRKLKADVIETRRGFGYCVSQERE
jgi:two-component system, OmpR family, response regulator